MIGVLLHEVKPGDLIYMYVTNELFLVVGASQARVMLLANLASRASRLLARPAREPITIMPVNRKHPKHPVITLVQSGDVNSERPITRQGRW